MISAMVIGCSSSVSRLSSSIKNIRRDFVRSLRLLLTQDFNATAASFFLLYNNLLVNAFFQFGNVRDNTHKQIALCQIVQDFQSLRQSILIKRSEALINKHCNLPPPKRPTAIVSSPVEAEKQTVTKISSPSVL